MNIKATGKFKLRDNSIVQLYCDGGEVEENLFKKIKNSLRVLISLIALKETREARVSDR